jgi:hypothetical protein
MERRNLDLERVFGIISNTIDENNNLITPGFTRATDETDDSDESFGKKMSAKDKAFADREVRRRELKRIVKILNTKGQSKKQNDKLRFTGKSEFLNFLIRFYGPGLEEFNY